MSLTENRIQDILKTYPSSMSKEQFYKAANISKATALYLLQNGLVPCEDTGKKTRRYTVMTEDVIAYLQDRELHPYKYDPPYGWYSDRSKKGGIKDAIGTEMLRLNATQKKRLRSYFEKNLAEHPDILTTEQASGYLGYSKTALVDWCSKKKIKCFLISGKYLIPKISFVDFLVSKESFSIHKKSEMHKYLLRKFISRYKTL